MKRTFSLFMALACLFGCLTFSGIAHAEETAFTDVTNNTPNAKAIFTLTNLGIINGYQNDDSTFSFKPNGDITRAEFSKIMTVALGAADENATGNHDFTDIDSHWAKPYVITAAGRGIVNGFEDKTFRPDENVTYEQAVKMIVCAAGYETIAQSRGGWPNGYMAQAADLGITKDAVSGEQSGKVSRGVVAQLVYNVLDVEIMQFGMEATSKTFLEEYLGIVRVEAKIVGVEDKVTNDFSGKLYLDEMAIRLRDGSFVVLDYTTYIDDKTAIENYLGQEAVVYYKKGKSGAPDTLYQLDLSTVKNTVVAVNSDDIYSYSSGSLKYYDENNARKNIEVDPQKASVYYNGKIVTNPASQVASWLDPTDTDFIYGEVRLTDSGSDGSVEIVEITDYDFLVVAKTPSSVDYIVSNKVKFTTDPVKGYVVPADYISQVILEPDNNSRVVNITNQSGQSITATSLKTNDVLLVAESLDGKLVNVKVNSTPVTGKISAVSSDGDITINGKTYQVSDYATEYFKQNNITIAASNSGTFYVDSYGMIVYGTQTATAQATSPYVYIIRAFLNDDETTGKLIAYVPSSNTTKTYELSGKIKYNGATKTVDEVIVDLQNNKPADGITPNFAVPDAGGACYSGGAVTLTNACQVGRITIEGNYVKEIAVAESASYGNAIEGMIVPFKALASTKYSGANSFNSEFYVNSSTTFVYVPQNRAETKSYAKKSISSFTVGTNYWVQPYNVSNSKVAELVVVYGRETETVTVKKNTPVSIMAKAHATKIDESSDDELYDVNYYTGSDKLTNRTASKTENCDPTASDDYTAVDIGSIGVGDLFRVGTDSQLGLVNAELILDYDDVRDAIDNNNSDFTGIFASPNGWLSFDGNYGRVIVANVLETLEDAGKYSIRVTKEGFVNGELNPATEELVTITADTIIYRVDKDNNQVTPFRDEAETERLDATDFREARYEGINASRVAIYSYSTNTANRQCKMILIYD